MPELVARTVGMPDEAIQLFCMTLKTRSLDD